MFGEILKQKIKAWEKEKKQGFTDYKIQMSKRYFNIGLPWLVREDTIIKLRLLFLLLMK